MKRQSMFLLMIACIGLATTLGSCYREPNPLDSLTTIGGPVAIVRSLTATPTTAAAGATVTATVTYTTLESNVTAVNLYAQVGTAARTRVANVSVNVAPSPNRVVQTLTYTVPAGTARGTIILLVAGVVTDGGESFSGSGVRNSAGTVTITVN